MSTDDTPRDASRHSDLAVLDANEYKNKRRLERILDAHDSVEDVASDAYNRFVNGEIDEHGKNISIQLAVKRFIREIYQLLQRHEEDLQNAGDETHSSLRSYLVDTDLGGVTFERRDAVSFDGLNDFLLSDLTYVETWRRSVESRHGPSRTVDEERIHSVPEDISWHAYLTAREFLDEANDLEIQFEELDDTLPNWGFDEIEDGAEDDVKDTAELVDDGDSAEAGA